MTRFTPISITLCLALSLGRPVYGEETLTVTSGQGTVIKVGVNTLVEMQTDEKGVETYILTPAASTELAGVTIIDPGDPERGVKPTETKASGKKITIWLPPQREEGQANIDFLIEGEARIDQGPNRMYGSVSIQFREQMLTIRGSAEKEGTLLYTFEDGRHIDWEGQEFRIRFKVDEDGRYVLSGFDTPKPSTRLNFFHPGMKGGVAHLIPAGRSSPSGTGEPARKVSQ